jgi:hypothetical protein
LDRPRLKLPTRLVVLALCFPAVAVAVNALLWTEPPVWLRVGLALTPLIPGAFFLRAQRRALAKADELGLHVASEAFGFVFYALIGLFVCVDLLRNAGVLPDFAWTTGKLLVAMLGLALIGAWVSNRRYR